MKQGTKAAVSLTVGLDVGDQRSTMCVLDQDAVLIESGEIATTRKAIRARFGGQARMRVVLETGTHANWLDEELRQLGHEVIVANARRVRAITSADRKDDRKDAEMLARLGRSDVRLLCPVNPRSESVRKDLLLLRARAVFVAQRTLLVNHVRGAVKPFGLRMPEKSTAAFHKLPLPKQLVHALAPMMQLLEVLTEQIAAYDEQIEALGSDKYPQTSRLRQVHGVGPLTSAAFVLTIVDPTRFKDSRDVGAYLGLTPRKYQSGASDPQLRITKSGDTMMRTLLVQCAQHILRRSSPDSDLKRFGTRLAKRGGKSAKQRAVVATARKLSVLLLALWKSGMKYEPLRSRGKNAAGTQQPRT